MFNDIEETQAAYDLAQTLCTNLRAELDEAVKEKNQLRQVLYGMQLDAMGVVVGETVVHVRSRWSDKELMRDRRADAPLRYLVTGFTPSGTLRVTRLKKDGTPSMAGTGMYGVVTPADIVLEGVQ